MIAFQVAGGEGVPGGMTKENLNQKALDFRIRQSCYACYRSEQWGSVKGILTGSNETVLAAV